MGNLNFNLLFFAAAILCLPAGSACEREDFDRARASMVKDQIVSRGVKDPKVIKAMETVPRHLFVPPATRPFSYGDYPVSIGEGQTISQPYIVAYMTEALELSADDRVLEIGTGSGYQAAILAKLAKEVYTIEIVEALGKRADKTLGELGYKNIHTMIGDGHKGWPGVAPFDAIIVTCAAEDIPQALVSQLKDGGRMIIPVGRHDGVQQMVKLTKAGDSIKTREVMDVRFVPMVKE